MPIAGLLDRICDIWGTQLRNPEVEDSVDTEVIVFPRVACRIDNILYRRSIETTEPGGEPGIRRAIIFIQDARLHYPQNFNENNWLTENGIRWDILSVDEADDMFQLHHYEVNCQAGRYR